MPPYGQELGGRQQQGNSAMGPKLILKEQHTLPQRLASLFGGFKRYPMQLQQENVLKMIMSPEDNSTLTPGSKTTLVNGVQLRGCKIRTCDSQEGFGVYSASADSGVGLGGQRVSAICSVLMDGVITICSQALSSCISCMEGRIDTLMFLKFLSRIYIEVDSLANVAVSEVVIKAYTIMVDTSSGGSSSSWTICESVHSWLSSLS
eukprot:Gb_11485 [translate_table: standard]